LEDYRGMAGLLGNKIDSNFDESCNIIPVTILKLDIGNTN
jgi:hypothetical protein